MEKDDNILNVESIEPFGRLMGEYDYYKRGYVEEMEYPQELKGKLISLNKIVNSH